MQKHTINCDLCKKELMKTRSYENREDHHTLEISNPTEGAYFGKTLMEADFCKTCVEKIINLIKGKMEGVI